MVEYSITADDHKVWPGDLVWVKHDWGWEQHTIGECFKYKITYTCADREGYIGSRIEGRVYFELPEGDDVRKCSTMGEGDDCDGDTDCKES